MKLSASMELVWQLAAREAMAGEFKEIAPEHILAAVLKFSELPPQKMAGLGVGDDVARLLAGEAQAVHQELLAMAIDSTRARRELRVLLGKGGYPFSGGGMHRSHGSRDCFEAAARLAGEARTDTLTVLHLLKALLASPTERMSRVIGKPADPKAAKPPALPKLDAIGRDLSKLAAERALDAGISRQAECKAVLQALGQKSRKSVFLVADGEETAKSVVRAAAKAMTEKTAPAGLQGRRIIDITTMSGCLSGDGPARRQAMELFAEAASAPAVILYIPSIDLADDIPTLEGCGAFLKAQLKGGAVQCICRVAPPSYALLAKSDKAWKQMVEVLYIHDRRTDVLPQEL